MNKLSLPDTVVDSRSTAGCTKLQSSIFVHNLRSFSCVQYILFFHLWGNGGPNWQAEFRSFMEEELVSWTAVRDSTPKKSFADAVRANLEPIGKPKISNSIRARLHFPRSQALDHLSAPANRPRPAPNGMAVTCARCLLAGHPRVSCRRPIRCRACLGWGHIAATCRAPAQLAQRQESVIQQHQSSDVKAKAVAPSDAGLFKSLNAHRPSTSEPLFKSLGDLFRSFSSIPA